MTVRGLLGRLIVAALVAGLLVAGWQASNEVGRQAVVEAPAITHWKPRPEPPAPTEPWPGAWCGYRCRNGHMR